MIAFRRATDADAALVVENLAAGLATYADWAPGWKQPPMGDALTRTADGLARADVWGLLAFDDGAPAGHVLIASSANTAVLPAPPGHMLLWQLFVRRPWHGTGLASELLARAVAETRARGIERIALWTPRDHARARRFYEREGWAPTGRAEPGSPLGLPVVQYARAV